MHLAVESTLARGTRITGLGLAFAAVGYGLRRRRQAYLLVLVPVLTGFTTGLALVVAGWS